VNLSNSRVLQMVMDSLRYWAQEMHVDGFRFDLATILAREPHGFDEDGRFLDACRQDPLLSQVKLIAEPWDCGPGGYQVGRFSPGWAEWNDGFRDTVRAFWKGEEGKLPDLAARLTASADLFNKRGRRPWASVNFVTAHDGFTLNDLVSYEDKHNEANGEENRDGHSHNLSMNYGVEGPTEDPEIRSLRFRHMRNVLATLLLSRGTPMILAGDEFARSQQGNNNAYCQDNEISWFDWEHADQGLLQYTRRLIRLRHRHPVFCRRRWFHGRPIRGGDVSDIGWFTPGGALMSEDDWRAGFAKSLGVFLNGRAISTPDERGEQIVDDSFYVMLNAHHEALDFHLPARAWGEHWTEVLDTFESGDEMSEERLGRELVAESVLKIEAWSVVLLRRLK
jgi:isoamylase